MQLISKFNRVFRFLLLIKIDTVIDTYSKYHSHKKRKDSLEGNLYRLLFAAELEFPKILVLGLPQHTSNVNIECSRKSD